jgi:AraC-like DNA-binding protein/mannose-6-phosphate isomerase-like protein (cupin superfamily)
MVLTDDLPADPRGHGHQAEDRKGPPTECRGAMNVRVTWFEQAFGHAKIWSATGSRTASSRAMPVGSTGDQSLYGSSRTSRTFLTVHQAGGRPLEVTQGAQSSWRFRPHFHAGDEIVRLLAGRARLRLRTTCREIAEGETVVVPAGMVHRFEPLDDKGWAFTSEFVLRPANTPSAGSPDAPAGDELAKRAMMRLAHRRTLQTDVDSIARDCAVSAGHLARAFRRVTGTSLHNFHVLLALHKAKAQLKEGALLVDAAVDSGFYDQAHLTREFVRTFGMTPGTFRSAWMDR